LIRKALYCGSANLCAEDGTDLDRHPVLWDAGDLHPASGLAGVEEIERVVSSLLENQGSVLALGGDHAVTFPAFKAHARKYGPISILHLDAHPDLYDEFEGNRFSHACPFARIMEEGLASGLVQVGIRTLNPHQRQQADRFGVQIFEMRHWKSGMPLPLKGPVYISLDMDVLDPAYAPGISHHEPGGMSTREVLDILQSLEGPVVGADIVEYNPTRDVAAVTAMTAAKLLKEISAKLLEGMHA
jgi:arginase